MPQVDPCGDRQTLGRPGSANEDWLLNFVFDRVASCRSIKSLKVVDDATHEAVAVVSEHSISGDRLTRISDQVWAQRARPPIIQSDNGAVFTGKVMRNWAYLISVTLKLNEPVKRAQNAFNESFNGRLRYECRNEHWFINLPPAVVVIEIYQREYSEERP